MQARENTVSVQFSSQPSSKRKCRLSLFHPSQRGRDETKFPRAIPQEKKDMQDRMLAKVLMASRMPGPLAHDLSNFPY
jgi:hypothetical protein